MRLSEDAEVRRSEQGEVKNLWLCGEALTTLSMGESWQPLTPR